MLRILYYLCKKSGKISTKKGGGLIIRHGHIIRILRYVYIGPTCPKYSHPMGEMAEIRLWIGFMECSTGEPKVKLECTGEKSAIDSSDPVFIILNHLGPQILGHPHATDKNNT